MRKWNGKLFNWMKLALPISKQTPNPLATTCLHFVYLAALTVQSQAITTGEAPQMAKIITTKPCLHLPKDQSGLRLTFWQKGA